MHMPKTARILLIAACLAMPVAAFASSCPEGAKLAEPRELPSVKSKGVKAEVLETVDLTGWRDMGNFRLRTRLLTIDAGAVVATHNHGDRPSIVYVVSGEIIEHNAFCSEPIFYKAGDHSAESGVGTTHWWENTSDQPVVIISSDVVPFKAPVDDNGM